MPEIAVEFEVYCQCGNGLCGSTRVHQGRGSGASIEVEACDRCIEAAKEEGRSEGYEECEKDNVRISEPGADREHEQTRERT